MAGFNGRRLSAGTRAVTLKAGLGVSDLERDGCRKLDIERVTVVQRDRHVLVLEHVLRGVAHLGRREGDLVVGAEVHEHEVLTVGVQVLVVGAVDDLGLDLRASVERAVDDLAGHDVLHLGANERAALAWLDVLEVDDRPQLAVHVENDAVLDVSGGVRHGVPFF